MKLGVQLFGSMPLYNADPAGFLAQLRAAGYETVGPCAVFGPLPPRFGWPAAAFEEHWQRAKSLGLDVESVHLFAADFSQHTEAILSLAKTFGIRAFVVGLNGPFTREAAQAFAAKCLGLADALAPLGTQLWLHNNAAEIRAKFEDLSVYETVLRLCGGKLGAQVDTGWVVCGGEPLAPFLARNAAFIRSIHHKDIRSIPAHPAPFVHAACRLGSSPPSRRSGTASPFPTASARS